MAQVSGGNRPILVSTFLLGLNLIGLIQRKRDLENSHLSHCSLGLNPRNMIGFVHILSHPEIFEFQDVIKIKNKTTIFS